MSLLTLSFIIVRILMIVHCNTWLRVFSEKTIGYCSLYSDNVTHRNYQPVPTIKLYFIITTENRKCTTLFRISRSGLCSRIIRQDWKARRRTACLMTRCKTVSSSVVVVAFTSLPVFSSASMTATMSSRPLVATTCSGLCPS